MNIELCNGSYRDSKPAIFPPPVCSTPGEAGKNERNWFVLAICGLPQALYKDLRLAGAVYSGRQTIYFY
jgi:hypothetical protein